MRPAHVTSFWSTCSLPKYHSFYAFEQSNCVYVRQKDNSRNKCHNCVHLSGNFESEFSLVSISNACTKPKYIHFVRRVNKPLFHNSLIVVNVCIKIMIVHTAMLDAAECCRMRIMIVMMVESRVRMCVRLSVVVCAVFCAPFQYGTFRMDFVSVLLIQKAEYHCEDGCIA